MTQRNRVRRRGPDWITWLILLLTGAMLFVVILHWSLRSSPPQHEPQETPNKSPERSGQDREGGFPFLARSTVHRRDPSFSRGHGF